MDYVKIEKTKETLKSLKIRWANMLKNLLNQINNNFIIENCLICYEPFQKNLLLFYVAGAPEPVVLVVRYSTTSFCQFSIELP